MIPPVDNQTIHHIYHNDRGEPTIDVEVERNSRGFNYRVKVGGARSVEEAIELSRQAMSGLEATYGNKQPNNEQPPSGTVPEGPVTDGRRKQPNTD